MDNKYLFCGTATSFPMPEEMRRSLEEMEIRHQEEMKRLDKEYKEREKERIKQEEIYHEHNKTELKDLIYHGTWDLYGVCNNTIKIGCQKCGQILFVEILEDPNDGYRSMLGEVKVTKKSDGIFVDKPIDTVYFDEFKYSSTHESPFEGYRILGTENKYTWLLFGTENYDDYYPCFVFNWNPKAPQ